MLFNSYAKKCKKINHYHSWDSKDILIIKDMVIIQNIMVLLTLNIKYQRMNQYNNILQL